METTIQTILKNVMLFMREYGLIPAEGCIDCDLGNDPKRPIILKLKVINGKISGEMDASAWLINYRKEKDKTKILQKPKTKKEKEEQERELVIRMVLDMLHKNLLVEGELTFNHGHIVITDFHDGKRELFGIAKIFKEENFMKMEMIGKHFLGIPDKANLYRIENEDGKPCKEVQANAPWICGDSSIKSELQ